MTAVVGVPAINMMEEGKVESSSLTYELVGCRRRAGWIQGALLHSRHSSAQQQGRRREEQVSHLLKTPSDQSYTRRQLWPNTFLNVCQQLCQLSDLCVRLRS